MGRFVFMVISQVGIENKQKSASGGLGIFSFMSDFPSKGYESGIRGECSILAFEARQEPTRKSGDVRLTPAAINYAIFVSGFEV